MYDILCRSPERPFALSARSDMLRENRLYLNEPARQTFAMLGAAMMALAILPALSGHWLVPVFCLMTMGGLVFALKHHGRAKLDGEVLAIAHGTIRHLRAIRRRAWFLVALGLVGQIAGAALDPATQSGAATAAPIQEIVQ